MRRSRARPALLLLVLLTASACKQTSPAASESGAAATAATAPAAAEPAAPACPDADFAAFLKRFEASVEVQRASTADPLTMDSVNSEAMPEPKPVTRQVPLAEVEFPVLSGPSQRESEGLQETVTELGPSEREVTHGIPDSDMQVRFKFRAEPCWKLVRVSNDTI